MYRNTTAADEPGSIASQPIALIDDVLLAHQLSTAPAPAHRRSVDTPRRRSTDQLAGYIVDARMIRDGVHDYVVITYRLAAAGSEQTLQQRIRLTIPLDRSLHVIGVMAWPTGGLRSLVGTRALIRLADVEHRDGHIETIVAGLTVTDELMPRWAELLPEQAIQ